MISYALRCDRGHSFESWFQSSAAFDSLKGRGHVTCAVCGSDAVDKAVMAPRVTPSRKSAAAQAAHQGAQPVPASAPKLMAAPPDAKLREMLAEMRAHVEKTSDYVGDRFAAEARAIHLGDAPDRAIYGEARPDEARALIEDGVPVLPLPFRPTRKSN